MTAPWSLTPHLSSAELEHRYRACPDGVERTHWQIVWLIAQGHHVPAVADLLGASETWIRTIVHRYNTDGPAGLRDRRRTNPGAMPLVGAEVREDLRQLLADPPPDGGLWTGPTLAAWLADRLHRPVHPQRGWETLRSLGFTPQRPSPRATDADSVAQVAFTKGGLPRR